jgi:hypothetical protein
MTMTLEEKAEQLRTARRVVKLAEDKLEATVRELFKPGDEIRWSLGAHTQTGTVVRIGYKGRITAENGRTGKVVHIDAFHVCEAFGLAGVAA